MRKAAITFDIDWAPDWAIDSCYKICKDLGVPATFFVTHKSDVLEDLRADPNIELAIHPNLLPGSTHGNCDRAVLDHCLELVPEAKAMRTHGLYQSSRLFFLIAEYYSMIDTDVSLCLPGHKGLHPVDFFCGARITRLPYFWEDDINAMYPKIEWECTPQSDGLRIFNFHPIHVLLNMSTLDSYYDLKCSLGSKKLHNATPRDVEPYINRMRNGTQTFLRHIISDIGTDGFSTISAITQEYRQEI